MIEIEKLATPEKFKATHFAHVVGDDWYLVPNSILKDTETNLDDEHFECWLFSPKGILITGIPYMMSKAQLGFAV